MSLSVAETTVEGKWVRVPALDYKGRHIIVKGTWLRLAQLLDEEWLDTELEDPELCAKVLKSQRRRGLQADILTFAQKPPVSTPKYDYYAEWDSIAAVKTTSFREWWEGLPRASRQNVRRSQKRGVKVFVKPLDDQLIHGIMGVNNQSPIRQGIPNRHYGKTFQEVKKDHSSFLEHCDYICAYVGEELIGFIWLIYRGEIASILQILTKASHRDKRPANALIAKAVELCELKGLLYLTYGMFNYGNKKHNSLREFKERNGFSEVLVPRFYVPLTAWGKFCMRAKLHRGLLGILPHKAIMAGVRVRSMFYHLLTSKAVLARRERPQWSSEEVGTNLIKWDFPHSSER
jgi:acetyltransferase (GNAT) family protein